MFIWHNGQSRVAEESSFSSIMFKTTENLVRDTYSTFFDVTYLALGKNNQSELDESLSGPAKTFLLNIMRFKCDK